MLSRILVAVVGIPVLIYVFCIAPIWACAVLLALCCIVASYELCKCTIDKRANSPWWMMAGVIGTLFVLSRYQFELATEQSLKIASALLLLFAILTFVLFACMILEHGKENALTFDKICICLFAAFAIPFGFSTLLSLRMMEYGAWMIMIPIVSAFCSDACALFVGMSAKKPHKLIERVSPKKTKEGAAGGIIGGIIGMIAFRIIFFLITEIPLHIVWCVLLGVIGSVFGQMGDLFFSVIKREYGIKDYGKLLPGHGGVLDRFDSVLFASPVIWILLSYVITL